MFNIHARPMWEANIDAQYVLDPYFVVGYCIFYLTKINKSITQEMQSMLSKCKHEQYELAEQINVFRKYIFKCTTNVYSTSNAHIIIK